MFPCAEGEFCLRRGGAACIGACEGEDVRTCGEWHCQPVIQLAIVKSQLLLLVFSFYLQLILMS